MVALALHGYIGIEAERKTRCNIKMRETGREIERRE
jgi:hypothetical protein